VHTAMHPRMYQFIHPHTYILVCIHTNIYIHSHTNTCTRTREKKTPTTGWDREPVPYEEMVRIENAARMKAEEFATRNIHIAKFNHQREHNSKQVLVWGSNCCGELGVGNDVDQPSPVTCPAFRQHTNWYGKVKNVYANAAGYHTFISLDTEPKECLAFGYNRFGQLGLGLLPLGEENYPEEVDLDSVTQEEDEAMTAVRVCLFIACFFLVRALAFCFLVQM